MPLVIARRIIVCCMYVCCHMMRRHLYSPPPHRLRTAQDAAKLFGKKFASGAAVSKSASGVEEIVIQGDVQQDLPSLLTEHFKVPPTSIYFQEGNSITRYAN